MKPPLTSATKLQAQTISWYGVILIMTSQRSFGMTSLSRLIISSFENN